MAHPAALCIVPHLEGIGGPASFYGRLTTGLKARGITVTSNPLDKAVSTVLVIGGISRLTLLWDARRRGKRIVQRLNGMNWIHRRRFSGLRHFMRSEWNNFVLATIRRSLADRIVYQSLFARTWWQTVYRSTRAQSTVIYNGVDLQAFAPVGPHERPDRHYRLLLVEGRLGGGNEMGLENAVQLAQRLNRQLDSRVELLVAGDVPKALQASFDRQSPGMITWLGVVRRDQIPQLDRSAHVLFSADLNAACPNSVIEALACGLPVVSYATGSLPELLEGDAGLVVPWGSNFWKLQPPDIPMLADAARRILREQEHFRPAARARAEATFGLETMVDQYMNILFG